MSEIVGYQSASLTERTKYAQTLAHAGDLIPKGLWAATMNPDGTQGPPAPSPGKILLVMETGAMLGLEPMAALQSIDVIEGKATLSSQLRIALVRRAGHTVTKSEEGDVKSGTYRVTATLTRSDGEVFTSTWGRDEATVAGLMNKFNWQKHFAQMCWWRASGDVARQGASEALFGMVYTPDEVEGGVSIEPDPEPEASEDWAAQFDAAQTAEEVYEISERIKTKGEGTDALRVKRASRLGAIEAEANTVDAEEVTDDESGDSAASAAGDPVSTGEPGTDGATDRGGEQPSRSAE